MAKTTRAQGSARADGMGRRRYRVSGAKIVAAQRVLGTATATATIEAALDAVPFGHEPAAGTRALAGLEIAPFDEI